MKFTMEDFPDLERPDIAVANAQYAFDKWLSEQVEMFCRRDEWRDGSHLLWAADECPYFARATHSARLVDIREIKK